MSIPLKAIRVENHHGEELRICDCHGCGTLRIANEQWMHKDGRKFVIGQYLTEDEGKLFRKKSKSYESKPCDRCHGAGMVRVAS